jgi:excisionase family DNA binding protein
MVNPEDMDKMLTIGEVADMLHVHINTVRRWNNQGILKAYRIGPRGVRRFRHQDISNFLSQSQDFTRPEKL